MGLRSRLQSITAWMPNGTAAVGVGLIVNGIATYVFLGLPARSNRLDPDQYAIFSTLWFTAYLIGPGLFIPLEQELARRVATARATGVNAAAHERALFAIASVAAAVVAVALAIFAGPLADRFFGGERLIVVVLALAIASTGIAQWVKGLLSGRGRFTQYGILVGAEGLARVGILAAVVLASPTHIAPYTAAVAISPLVALLVLRGSLDRPNGPMPAGVLRSAAAALGVLASAQIAAQFLMNGVPLALAALTPDSERATVGRIGAALVLARIPLFLFQAVQASLLPGLASLAALGDMTGFERRVRSVSGGIAGLGLVAIGGGAALGPLATRILFGADFEAGRYEFASLVAAAVAVVLALVAAQALIALGKHRLAATGWLVGALGFMLSLLGPLTTLTTVLIAGIVGPLTALAAMVTMLRRAVASA